MSVGHEYGVTPIMLKFAKEHPWNSLLYALSLAVVPVQNVLLPHLYGRVVNAIQKNRSLVAPFVHVVVVIAAIHIATALGEWNEVYHIFPSLQRQIQRDTLAHIFRVHETNYDDQHTAALIASMVKIPGTVYSLVDQHKNVLVPQAIVCFSIIAYFYAQDKLLAYGVALAVIVLLVYVNIAPRWCVGVSSTRESIMNRIYDAIDDLLRNMMAVFNNGTLAEERAKLDIIHDTYRTESLRTVRCVMMQKAILIPLIIGTSAFFMWRCFNLSQQKRLDTGTFVSLFMIMISLMGAMVSYMNQVKDLTLRKGSLIAFLNEMPKTGHLQRHTSVFQEQPRDPQSVLETKNVSYQYLGGSTRAVDRVSVVIRRGQKVLLQGKIGCGKSTLVKLWMKYHVPVEGDLRLEGTSYAALTAKDVRARVGYIPQIPVLFDRTLYENIVYGLRVPNRQEVERIIQDTKLSFSVGLDERVGKGGSKLSGGQRQMVWFLRLILHRPNIIIMDEPTAAIDPATKELVHRLIETVLHDADTTVVMVTHDQTNMHHFDRVITMDQGRIVDDITRA